MPQFSDEYFRDLPPRERRYDTPVADQLVFSVFPNGVKAWVHVYPCDDYVRRRTMGLFPNMGLAAARAALKQSRRIAEVDAQQLRGGRPARKMPTGMILTAVVAAAVGSLATFMIVSTSPPPAHPASSGGQQVAGEATTGKGGGAPGRESGPLADGASPVVTPSSEPEPDAGNSQTEDAAGGGSGIDVVDDRLRGAAPGHSGGEPMELGAEANTPPAVSRAVLTSGIDDREPTDRLAGQLELPGAGPLTIFFFTELRGLGGHTVSHRWSRHGETVGELPFEVGEGTDWRVYSSKEIGPEGVGAWSVQVVDEQGRVLESVDFVVRAPSQTAEETQT
jgi:hypothetical protein